jgi:hypothetical protein
MKPLVAGSLPVNISWSRPTPQRPRAPSTPFRPRRLSVRAGKTRNIEALIGRHQCGSMPVTKGFDALVMVSTRRFLPWYRRDEKID